MGGELRRRLVHTSGTTLPVLFLLGVVDWRALRYLLIVGSLLAAGLETVRLIVGLDWSVYEALIREYERTNVAGYALYMFSMTAVALLFDPPIAVPGMLMLTVGDPISGLLGSAEAGRAKRAGVIAAMFAVCFSLAFVVLVRSVAVPTALVAAAVGSAGATAADGLTPVVRGYVIDDNATIPPMACLGIWLVLQTMG